MQRLSPNWSGQRGSNRVEERVLGLRKLLRAAAILILPVVGIVFLYESTSNIETLVGVGLIAFAMGLVATWFWQPFG